MTSAANPNHEIHILSSYLAYGTEGKHWHLIHEELSELIAGLEIDYTQVRSILGTGDPKLIRQLIDHPNAVPLNKLVDYDAYEINPLRLVDLANTRPENRIEAYNLVAQFSDTTDLKVMSAVAKNAYYMQDFGLFKHVLAQNPELDLLDIIVRMDWTADIESIKPNFYVNFFDLIDIKSPHADAIAHRAAKTMAPRPIAVLIKMGYDMRSVLKGYSNTDRSWRSRLARRLDQGSHTMVAMISSMPDISDIAAMANKDLQKLLTGPSEKQQRLGIAGDVKAHQLAQRDEVRAQRAAKRKKLEEENMAKPTF